MFRASTFVALDRTPSSYDPLHTFDLPKGRDKTYQNQYADMYFLRLAKLKPAVEQIAAEAWDDLEVRPFRFHLLPSFTYKRLTRSS